MARNTTRYECSNCAHVEAKWVGKCPECMQYNSMIETAVPAAKPAGGDGGFSNSGRRTTATLSPTSLDTRSDPPARISTGHPELDRVLGGGLVEASAVLMGGAPGIGKSTILLQTAAGLSVGRRVVYISGEESLDQIQLRARRLGLEKSHVDLIASNDALAIADHIETLEDGSVVIVDSLQTLYCGGDSTPGSVSQVKQATAHLVPAAKAAGVTLIVVCHVTKEGNLAGPQVVVHTVDATLHIEQDMSSGIYRLIRSDKNRFGPIDEVGVFEMTEQGMLDVTNPSEIFISQRDETAFGSVIFPSLEGSRPVLLEIQALVAPTSFGSGRRSSTGWDSGRLNMLLATLSARLGLSLGDRDAYVNIAGGMKVSDPAMDLAVAAAILSAHVQVPLPSDLAIFGEIGLAGEIRNSSRAETRIKESANLGLSNIICPAWQSHQTITPDIHCHKIRRVADLFQALPDLKAVYTAGG